MADVRFYPATDADFVGFANTPKLFDPSDSHSPISETFFVPSSHVYQGPIPKPGTEGNITVTVDSASRTVIFEGTPGNGEVRINRRTGLITFHNSDAGGECEIASFTPFVTPAGAALLNNKPNLNYFGTMATQNSNNVSITGGSVSAGTVESTADKIFYRWASNPRLVPAAPLAPTSIGNGFITFNASGNGATLQYDLDVSTGDIINGLGCWSEDTNNNTSNSTVSLIRIDATTAGTTTTVATITAGAAAGSTIGEASGAVASITPHTVLSGFIYSILVTINMGTSTNQSLRRVLYQTTSRRV